MNKFNDYFKIKWINIFFLIYQLNKNADILIKTKPIN